MIRENEGEDAEPLRPLGQLCGELFGVFLCLSLRESLGADLPSLISSLLRMRVSRLLEFTEI